MKRLQVANLQSRLSLRQLRAFVAVYRLRKLTLAATQLSVTQSAVSVLIRQIEANLETRLFDRSTRVLEPTPAAHATIGAAERILREIDQLGSSMRELNLLEQGRVHVAATPAISMVLMPSAVRKFRQLHPNVRVVLDDCAPSQFVGRILTDQVEFGIGTPDGPTAGLDTHTLIKDHLCVVCAADHPLAPSREVRWSRLKGVPLIAGAPGYGIRKLMDATAAKAGVDLNVVNEVSFLSSALWMVSSGMGVAILPSSLAKLSHYDNLVARPLTLPRVARSLSLVTRQGRTLSAACAGFVRVLMADLASRRVAGLER